MTNVREGVAWLGYSYLAQRLLKNPLAYGISWDQLVMDPGLDGKGAVRGVGGGVRKGGGGEM